MYVFQKWSWHLFLSQFVVCWISRLCSFISGCHGFRLFLTCSLFVSHYRRVRVSSVFNLSSRVSLLSDLLQLTRDSFLATLSFSPYICMTETRTTEWICGRAEDYSESHGTRYQPISSCRFSTSSSEWFNLEFRVFPWTGATAIPLHSQEQFSMTWA